MIYFGSGSLEQTGSQNTEASILQRAKLKKTY